jgi:FMN phosphatase YigB (HAD superfamily)
MLKAVLFDLDDTLLLADNTALMREYFSRLTARFAGCVDPDRLQQQVVASTMHVLAEGSPDLTVLERFSRHFAAGLGLPVDFRPFMEFYAGEYAELGRWTQPAPGARAAVEAAQQLDLLVAVATNPVFPAVAVAQRLHWAGLHDIAWDLVTTADIMHYCKPSTAYFQETAAMLGVTPAECLMVGNDPTHDMPASQTGMLTFLVESETGDSEALRAFLPADSVADPQTGPTASFTGTLRQLPAVLQALAAGQALGEAQ